MHSFPGAGCTVEPEGHIGHGAVLHGCTVRSGAMVGMNAVVMDGADIGGRALVAANAFVPAGLVVPADHLAAGNPAKVIKELDADALAWKANGIQVYQELARRCRATLCGRSSPSPRRSRIGPRSRRRRPRPCRCTSSVGARAEPTNHRRTEAATPSEPTRCGRARWRSRRRGVGADAHPEGSPSVGREWRPHRHVRFLSV